MKVRFLSTTNFDSIFRVGAHHLAAEFSYVGDVQYFSAPTAIPRSLFAPPKPLLVSRLGKENITARNVKNFIPLRFAQRLPKSLANILSRPLLPTQETVDIQLVDSLEYLPYLHLFPSRKTIYRPTDIYSNSFENLRDLELGILKKLNLPIFCMSEKTAEYFVKNDCRVIGFCPNGVPGSFVSECEALRREKALAFTGKVKIVYVGALDERIDLNVLLKLATDVSCELSIFGHGPLAEILKNNEYLAPRFHGSIEYSQLPTILTSADVGLLPFSNSKENYSRSPMKYFEYVSAGLDVIGCNWDAGSRPFYSEFKQFNSVKQISDHFSKSRSESSYLSYRDAVSGFTWNKIAGEILSKIDGII